MARGTEAGDSRTINLETLFRTEDSSVSGYEGFHLNVVMGFYAKLTLTVAPSQLASPGVLPIKCFCSVIKQTDIAWISCPSSEQVYLGMLIRMAVRYVLVLNLVLVGTNGFALADCPWAPVILQEILSSFSWTDSCFYFSDAKVPLSAAYNSQSLLVPRSQRC